MKLNLFILLSCLIFASSCKSYRMRSEVARNHIFTLKEGVMLVRLQTLEGKIKNLREIGQQERADETEKKRDEKNRHIVQAYKDHFDFCPVYFFYSGDSKEIMNGNFEGHLMNFDLESIAVPAELSVDNWLMSEFARNQEPISGGSENATTGLRALIIKDRDLVQLKKPFPKYFHYKDEEARIYPRMVRQMNNTFINYHHSSQIKEAKLEWKKKSKTMGVDGN